MGGGIPLISPSASRLATWREAAGWRDGLVSRELCSLHHQPCGGGRQRAQDGAAAGGDRCVGTEFKASRGRHSFSPSASRWEGSVPWASPQPHGREQNTEHPYMTLDFSEGFEASSRAHILVEAQPGLSVAIPFLVSGRLSCTQAKSDTGLWSSLRPPPRYTPVHFPSGTGRARVLRSSRDVIYCVGGFKQH